MLRFIAASGGGSSPDAVISPLSIMIALAMLAGGATPENQAEMCDKLGLPATSNFEKEWKRLSIALGIDPSGAGGHGILLSSCAVITTPNAHLLPDYITHLSTFDALIDECTNLVAAVDVINGWISDHTLGLIPKMLTADMVKYSDLLLINTLAMKAKWEKPFNAISTSEQPFYRTDKQKSFVQMMHLGNESILSYRGDTYRAICLPYKSSPSSSLGSLSMILYLPNPGVSLGTMMEERGSNVPISRAQFTPELYTVLGIPKFEVESKFEVLDFLQSIGYCMTDYFPHMTREGSIVQLILHQAIIKVGEAGTEAAAATVVVACFGSARPRNETPPNILIFDRPFIYSIVHDDTNMLLFAGTFNGKK